LTDFQFVNNDEASTSYEEPKLSYTEKGMKIVNQPSLPRSLNLTKIPRFNHRNLLLSNTNNYTYKVKLYYINEQIWIENKILIDTGAFQIHCIPLLIPVITSQEYNFITYDGRQSRLNYKGKIMMKTPNTIF